MERFAFCRNFKSLVFLGFKKPIYILLMVGRIWIFM